MQRKPSKVPMYTSPRHKNSYFEVFFFQGQHIYPRRLGQSLWKSKITNFKEVKKGASHGSITIFLPQKRQRFAPNKYNRVFVGVESHQKCIFLTGKTRLRNSKNSPTWIQGTIFFQTLPCVTKKFFLVFGKEKP